MKTYPAVAYSTFWSMAVLVSSLRALNVLLICWSSSITLWVNGHLYHPTRTASPPPGLTFLSADAKFKLWLLMLPARLGFGNIFFCGERLYLLHWEERFSCQPRRVCGHDAVPRVSAGRAGGVVQLRHRFVPRTHFMVRVCPSFPLWSPARRPRRWSTLFQKRRPF